jgi:putative endonuclease
MWAMADGHDIPVGASRAAERAALGRLGETLACVHLARRGFAVLARNQRTAAGEIDIVAFDGHTLLFVEVKTRRGRPARGPGGGRGRRSYASTPATPLAAQHFGWPSRRQRGRLRRLAGAWLHERPVSGRPRAREIRFDAVRVVLGQGRDPIAIDHVEGAW